MILNIGDVVKVSITDKTAALGQSITAYVIAIIDNGCDSDNMKRPIEAHLSAKGFNLFDSIGNELNVINCYFSIDNSRLAFNYEDKGNFYYYDYTATVEIICQTKNTGV
jgi:hypothetical protein